ncbi:DUF417 family protein [Sphingobacterium kitahiroshimense]|uniref:DUF417 family protein n=1 Tax=Sphingobacterium kitahiroshimense TaxID=470446 RepID=A0ABV0BP31_9SPHI
MKNISINKIGYTIGVLGVALILFWIGIFKFTATEAKSIEGLVKNSFLTSWLYDVTTLQGASNLIGAIEIATAIALVLHFYWKKIGVVAAVLAILTFLSTLSFILTTPGMFRMVDGILVTNFFILKDLMALGISLLVLDNSLEKNSEKLHKQLPL